MADQNHVESSGSSPAESMIEDVIQESINQLIEEDAALANIPYEGIREPGEIVPPEQQQPILTSSDNVTSWEGPTISPDLPEETNGEIKQSDDSNADRETLEPILDNEISGTACSSNDHLLINDVKIEPSDVGEISNIKSEIENDPDQIVTEEETCANKINPGDDVEQPTSSTASDLFDSVVVAGEEKTIDLPLIVPYTCAFSKAGVLNDGKTAVVVFYAKFLPERSAPNYQNLMDNLFWYALKWMAVNVTTDYIIVYFQGGAKSNQMPSFSWLRKCYKSLGQNVRKNLKQVLLVYSTFWFRALLTIIRPFLSSKFWPKLIFVKNKDELHKLVPIEMTIL